MERKDGKSWRINFTLPPEMEDAVVAMRQDPHFTRLSWSEIIRQLIERGIRDIQRERERAGA